MTTERTFGIMKPEAVAEGKEKFITQMIESEGLKIIRSELKNLDRSKLEKHYAKDDDWFNNVGANVLKTFADAGKSKELSTDGQLEEGKKKLQQVIDHMSSGPVIIMEITGENAVEVFRKLCGESSDPSKCPQNSIRGMLSDDNNTKAILEQRTMYNYLHSSENAEEASAEIALWFGN